MSQPIDKSNRLDKIIAGLEGDVTPEAIITRTISIRLPVLNLAQIDALASMKDVSRNVLLNEVIKAALEELLDKLKSKNPGLSDTLSSKIQQLAKNMMNEPEEGPKGPHHNKKHKKHE